MPELPEVEVMARNLARWTRGRTLVALEVVDPALLDPADVAHLAGRTLGAAHRRAKLCLLPV